MNSRFLIVILGSSKGIEENLNHIASSDFGVNYVDGNGNMILVYCLFFFSFFVFFVSDSFI